MAPQILAKSCKLLAAALENNDDDDAIETVVDGVHGFDPCGGDGSGGGKG